MEKTLIPTDFSASALKATKHAAEIATKNGPNVYMLHVIEPFTDSIRQPERLEIEIANNRLLELDALQVTLISF